MTDQDKSAAVEESFAEAHSVKGSIGNTLDYEFEELPLLVERGFKGGLVEGRATVSFDPDGTWMIQSISLVGYHKGSSAYLPVCHEMYPTLYGMIQDRLEHDVFKDCISDAVAARIDELREAVRESA